MLSSCVSRRKRKSGLISIEVSPGFPDGTSGEEPICQCKRPKTCGFDPWEGRFPGGEHGNPLQYSCLKNHMDRGAWQVVVHRVERDMTEAVGPQNCLMYFD